LEQSLDVLVVTALSLAVFHTVIGPDHYLPFIVLGRSEGWSLRRMLLWTTLCGLGHVLSSVLIGAVGIAVGWSLSSMEGFETWRGEIASTGLMVFGGLYMIYGLIQARRGHVHRHFHPDGEVHDHVHGHAHVHEHEHGHEHAHDHGLEEDHTRSHRRTLWVIFIIFVLGPCEPLIPLLMVPAAEHSAAGVALVASVFSVATILTMLVIATAGHLGLKVIRFGAWEKYVHVLSGGAILASGLTIELLGL
jgi:ABC-type nickel/cobalt efflux system permease component RcnA